VSGELSTAGGVWINRKGGKEKKQPDKLSRRDLPRRSRRVIGVGNRRLIEAKNYKEKGWGASSGVGIGCQPEGWGHGGES